MKRIKSGQAPTRTPDRRILQGAAGHFLPASVSVFAKPVHIVERDGAMEPASPRKPASEGQKYG